MNTCEMLNTEYGPMIVASHDINQTGALRGTGRGFHHARMVFLASLLDKRPPGKVFVDAGANLGTFAVPLSEKVDGMLHAFEPQPVICNMLAGSLALTQRTNIRVHNTCLGDRDGLVELPQFDYTKPLNFGSVQFGPEQREPLSQQRMHDVVRMETVEIRRLDSYLLPRVDLIKIDVEGMEIPLLNGAANTLSLCQPLLFIEWIGNRRQTLIDAIDHHGYKVQAEMGDDWLCIPK